MRGAALALAQARAQIATLQEREALLSRILEGIPQRVAYYDQERRLVYANTAYAQLLAGEAPPASVIGQTVQELLTPERAALHEPYVQRAFAGESVRYELPGFRSEQLGHWQSEMTPRTLPTSPNAA
jgi:PAS domain S-box-containing protein